MAIRFERCATCFYFEPAGLCVRFPAAKVKEPDSWCGEHKRDAERICDAEGAVIAPSRAMTLFCETLDLSRKVDGLPPRPPRKLSHEICLRAKGHEGKHANYRQEWE